MNQKRNRICLAALVAAFALLPAQVRRLAAADLPDGWIQDWNKGVAAAKAANKPILAVFSAQWCGPCQRMVHDVYPRESVKEALKDYVTVYVDIDKDAKTAAAFMVEAYPTTLFLSALAKEEDRIVGGRTERGFVKLIKNHPQYMAAMAKLEPQLAGQPTDAQFWKEIGDAYLLKEKNDKALEAYRNALKGDPADKIGVGDFVYLYDHLPQSEEDLPISEKAFADFETKYPKSRFLAKAAYFRALVTHDLGRVDDAKGILQEGLKRFAGSDQEDDMKAVLQQMEAKQKK